MAGLSIIVVFWGVARTIGGESDLIQTRLGRYTAREAERPSLAGVKEQKRPPIVAGLNRAIAQQSFGARTATELARADLKLTVAEYFLFNVASMLIGFLIALLLFRNILAMVGGLLGFYIPRLYVGLRQRRRLIAFNNQLGDTITLLANSLRSGYSLLQSMETVAKELAPPVSEEFGRVVREIGLGLSNEEALNNLLRRVNSDDLDLMITAINVHHEVGGNLAEILDTIGHTIRERVRIKGEIRSITAGQRFSGYVIAFLPFGLAALLFMLNREYMSVLFTDQCGLTMLVAAAMGMIAGFFIIQRIVAIEV
jgi:tight adherence protein B